MITDWLSTQPDRVRAVLDPSWSPVRAAVVLAARHEQEAVASLNEFVFEIEGARAQADAAELSQVKAWAQLRREKAEFRARIAELNELWKRSEAQLNAQRIALNETGIEATAPLPPGFAGCRVFDDAERIRILSMKLAEAVRRASELPGLTATLDEIRHYLGRAVRLLHMLDRQDARHPDVAEFLDEYESARIEEVGHIPDTKLYALVDARIASLEAENARLLAAMGPLGTPPLPNDPRLP